jgi:hypothetical protein
MNGLSSRWGSVTIIGLSLLAGACGKIPEAYRGKFIDEGAGVVLELGSRGGALTQGDGPRREFDARAMEASRLIAGEPGIYLRSVGGEAGQKDPDLLEVFWVRPDLGSLQEQYGFVSMRAEVVYTRFRADPKLPISSISARYCASGQILVDRVSQSFNGGCPGDSSLLRLNRVPAEQ